jgi:hypothetical protein
LLEVVLKKIILVYVSFIGCSHVTFVGVRQPKISSSEFKAFCTRCNIYREIKDFRNSRFIIIKIWKYCATRHRVIRAVSSSPEQKKGYNESQSINLDLTTHLSSRYKAKSRILRTNNINCQNRIAESLYHNTGGILFHVLYLYKSLFFGIVLPQMLLYA